MKHAILLALITLHSALSTLHAAVLPPGASFDPVPPPLSTAVPLRWTVETSRAQVAQFEAYRGETLDLEATMQSYGSPLAAPLQQTLYWQTNGMGNAWWTAPASASGNVLRATWNPTNDCGGMVYNCFIGGPDATYRAAFRLRMLPSPGFTPNHLKLPTVTYDAALFGEPTVNGTNLTEWVAARSQAESDPVFREWVRTNDFSSAGGSSSGVDTNAVNDLISSAIGTITPQRIGAQPALYMKDDGVTYLINVSGAENAGMAGMAVMDGSGNNIEFSYAKVGDVDDLHAQVNSLGDHYNEISGTVSAWQTYWDGDDVRATITNYYGALDIPSLYLEQKMPSDESHDAPWFKPVWDERTRWNIFLPQWSVLTNDVVQNKADRAWGVYDSSTGEYSPDGLLQLSQDQVMIASGMAWQKTVTAGGPSVWVLKSTNPTMLSGESEAGYFRIQDADGTPLFEIIKGDKKTVGATSTGINAGRGAVTISYNCVSADPPTLEWCSDIKSAEWEQVPQRQTGPSLGIVVPPLGPEVEWSGSSGEWTATVSFPIQQPPSAFFKASYEAGGNTYIRNNVATSIDKVVVGGVEYEVTVETVNGKKLLVLK